MVRACCSSVRPAWVGVTPCRARTSSGAPSASSMLRMRVRGGGQRQMGALRAVGDAAGFHDVAEQAQVGEIEAHAFKPSHFTKEAYRKGKL